MSYLHTTHLGGLKAGYSQFNRFVSSNKQKKGSFQLQQVCLIIQAKQRVTFQQVSHALSDHCSVSVPEQLSISNHFTQLIQEKL